MVRNRSISLGDHFASFVDRQVASGRYESASDVVRAGLRLLEEHEIRIAALRDALVEGENSGSAAHLDVDAFFERPAHDRGGMTDSVKARPAWPAADDDLGTDYLGSQVPAIWSRL